MAGTYEILVNISCENDGIGYICKRAACRIHVLMGPSDVWVGGQLLMARLRISRGSLSAGGGGAFCRSPSPESLQGLLPPTHTLAACYSFPAGRHERIAW